MNDMRMNDNFDELKTLHTVRGTLYSIFSDTYKLFPDKLLSVVADIAQELALLSASSESSLIKEGVEELNEFMNARKALSGKELDEFSLDVTRKYTSLLCIPNSSVMAEESFYTSKDKLVSQESRDKMRELLAKYGFTLTKDAAGYEDHIYVELSFMAWLAFGSAKALEEGDSDRYKSLIAEQIALHENHFDVWFDRFFDAILAFDIDEKLYKSMTKIAKGYIAEDKLLLSEL